MMNHPHPANYNIPHDHWRVGQYEAFQNILKSNRQFIIASAPVGSGKTMISAALGSQGRSTRALTHTRQLQDQYRKYHFDVLYGMAAYPCALNSIFQADMCAYMEKMPDCPASKHCQYLIQREFVKKSDRQSMSYAYAMLATWIESNSVDYVYQDEAHLIPDIVMAHMTIEISHKDCKKLQIDPYPLAKMDSQNARRIRITGWALDSLDKMLAEIIHLSKLSDKTPYDVRKLKLYKQFYDPLLNAINACSDMPDQFWVKSDEESLKIVPLTAAPFYKKMMAKGGERFVLTSATIGNPRTFSSALGIKSNEYDWVNTPSNFGPDEMPVYVYNDAPKMRYGMSDSERKEQVRLISKIIGERNPTWNTLIQTSSIRDANWIANELARKFGDRIYVPSLKTTTSQKIEDWRMQIARKPGTITLAWSFHAGVDAPEANINIIQKVPFAPLDEPGKALLDVNPKFYKWRAANQVEQACGRVRRGEIAHYEQIGEPERKHVAILDMNIEQVKSQTSDHFVRCLNYI